MVGLIHSFLLVCWSLRSIASVLVDFSSFSRIMPRKAKYAREKFSASLACANASGEFSGTANENVEDMFALNIPELNTQESVPRLVSDRYLSLCSLRKRA